MLILSASSPVQCKSALQTAKEVLEKGGVVAHATDTVFGLTADASNSKATAKVAAIKGTAPEKTLLLLLPSKAWADKLGQKLCKFHLLARHFWPGPLGLIVQAKPGLSSQLATKNLPTLGLRLPKHEFSLALARAFGRPLITTSANPTGQPTPTTAAAVAQLFARSKHRPDLIIDTGAECADLPSTLVDVSGSEARLLRAGAIPWEQIQTVLGSEI